MRVRLVLWALRRRPWRNVLIAVSVAVTVAVMIVFFSARFEIRKFLDRADEIPYQRLFVKPTNLANFRISYPYAMKDQLAKLPDVKQVVYIRRIFSKTPEGRVILVDGAASDVPDLEHDFFPSDRDVRERWKKERAGAIVTDYLAATFRLSVGDEGELPTEKGPLKFVVSGISRGGAFPTRMFLHFEYVDEFLGRPGVVTEYRIILDRETPDRPVVKAVDELLARGGFAAHLVTEKTVLQLAGARNADLIPNLLGAIGLLLMLTTGLAIANATVISVRERRAELATLRVLGFKRRVLASLVISEALLVCVTGGLVGALLAWIALRDGLSLGAMFLPSLTLTTSGLIAGLATSLVVPFVGCTFASWLAVRAPLGQALRDVG